METRFLDGGEYVDRQTFITVRDENSKLQEKIAKLEAEVAQLTVIVDDLELKDPGLVGFKRTWIGRAEAAERKLARLTVCPEEENGRHRWDETGQCWCCEQRAHILIYEATGEGK